VFKRHSLDNLFKSSVLVIAVLGLCSPRARSDSVTFNESQKDSLRCTHDEGCDSFTTGKFTMRGIFFSDIDLTEHDDLLATNTEVDVDVGDWSGSGVFSDDPHYKNGHPRATMKLIGVNDCGDKQVVDGTITFDASGNKLRITVSTKTGSTECKEFEDSAIADDHTEDFSGFTDTVTVDIDVFNDFDELSTTIDVPVTGIASGKTVVRGGETNDLNSVRVQGTE